MTGIEKAVQACGSQLALADAIGCTQQNVSSWIKRGFVPVDHLIGVEQASGIPRHELISPKLANIFSPMGI